MSEATQDGGRGSGTLRGDPQRIEFVVASTDDPLRGDGPNVIANLMRCPKKISSLYVYDKTGTELFERQCTTEEYYLRRVEMELLKDHAREIVELSGFCAIVELGAGTAEKTRLLFEEYAKQGACCDYWPIDVDSDTLAEAARKLTTAFPNLFVHCLGTTYQQGLRALTDRFERRLVLFLGSSIGNMELHEIDYLLWEVFSSSSGGDLLLLGADLHKPAELIDTAYNDSAGYGPRSTLNMLSHLNHRYEGNFVLDRFRYRSVYDSRARKNEVHIQSLVQQTVTLAALNFSVSFAESEPIEAEVMWKFDRDDLCARLKRAGFSMMREWIDPCYHYGLFLLYRG